MTDVAAIILAAGKSTRMQSDLPKVLHPVCGRPMLNYALDACSGAGIGRLVVVVGHQRERVESEFSQHTNASAITWVHQAEQLGTGHAVMVCEQALDGFQGDVVVLAGDMPLVRPQTVQGLLDIHRGPAVPPTPSPDPAQTAQRTAQRTALTLGTAKLQDPSGYGRILRDEAGHLRGIVEHADCSPEQLQIHEVNPSYYCFDSRVLFETLREIEPSGAKGEYYITDAVQILVSGGRCCKTFPGLPPEEALGVNAPEDLAQVEDIMRQRCPQLIDMDGST